MSPTEATSLIFCATGATGVLWGIIKRSGAATVFAGAILLIGIATQIISEAMK